jgi:plasmid rolling circle replication initiator protein Rep
MDILSINPSLAKASNQDAPWNTHRQVADSIQQVFLNSGAKRQIRRGERMQACGPYLIFKLLEDPESEEIRHRLRYAEFCRVRLCPTCMWRKSMAWRARFYQAWPLIQQKYRSARYFHLVLTVPNCEITDLRDKLNQINKAWKRMVDRKTWPALGFLRSVEVTRDKEGRAHPHLHILMMVKPEYFSRKYMNREVWREYWASALRIPAESLIHPYVRSVRGADDVSKLVLEIAKYAVKMKPMAKMLKNKAGQKWFLELDKQLENTKAITLGGALKEVINSEEITDSEMIKQDKIELGRLLSDVRYDWFYDEKSYIRTKFLDQKETEWWNKQEEKWLKRKFLRNAARAPPSAPISAPNL